MQRVEEPMETIHLYVVREKEPRPSLLPLILSLLVLCCFVAVGLLPYQQPEIRETLRVPAVLLPLKTFSTFVTVTSTGSKTYPATTAYGILTITNGSILPEELPKGIILTDKDGVEVVTDIAVFIPAGNGISYGIATVPAHAVVAGTQGNIAPLAINQVDGTSLYIRNRSGFSGGQAAYTKSFITSQDRQAALSQARQTLSQRTVLGLLLSPCKEAFTGNQTLRVNWTCQFVTYQVPHLPGVRVLSAQVSGNMVEVAIVYILYVSRLETK